MAQSGFSLMLYPEVKSLFNAVFAMANFFRLDQRFEFIKAVRDSGLIDWDAYTRLKETTEQHKTGEQLDLASSDILLLYILVDIYCKTFLSPVGDHLKKRLIELRLSNPSSYDTYRDETLRTGSRILDFINRHFNERPEFQRANDSLESLNHYLV